jgi:hypothetical protein
MNTQTKGRCIKCGSYAFNLYKEGVDQGGLCDVHYWQDRAHKAEAQPEQEPVEDVVAYHSDGTRTVRIAPKRPWVGLTEDELVQIGVATGLERAAAQMIESKLKEKNT